MFVNYVHGMKIFCNNCYKKSEKLTNYLIISVQKRNKLIVSFLFIYLISILSTNNAAFALKQGSKRRSPIVIAVEKVGPAVANISTVRFLSQQHGDPFFGFRSELFEQFFNDYFGQRQKKLAERPLGSGVIIDEEGYIVTNEHVVSRASKINVRLSNGENYEATMISSDPVSDLAVLKIESEKPLPYVQMGTSKDLMIGETVIALGNPFGLENSVTTGVLSAKNRTFTFSSEYGDIDYKGLLQTDALINPGNSGGPLINTDGELIGINSAIVNQAQGIGFAIPVDKVRQTLVKLFNFRELNKVWFGVQIEDHGDGGDGILVSAVEPNSPANKSCIKAGDFITKIDDKEIHDVLDFEKYILKKEVKDKLRISIIRDGETIELDAILEKAPLPSIEKLALEKLGIYIQDLTPALAKQLNLWWLKGGILISDVQKQSPAANVGIQPGYVLVSVGQYRVINIKELGTIIKHMKRGEVWDLGLVWSDNFGEHQGYTRIKIQ